jgi:hypothetical protein
MPRIVIGELSGAGIPRCTRNDTLGNQQLKIGIDQLELY